MYGLIGSMEAVAGGKDELVAILLEATTHLPGCLSYVVAADPTDAALLWVTEVWESEAAHQASLALPAVQEAVARGRPLIAGFRQRTITIPAGGHGLGKAAVPTERARDHVAPAEDRVVEVDALLSIPPTEAFAFFAENERLTRWLVHEADVEPRVGGKYELFWEPSDPENNSTIGCRVTAAAPGQLIAFQWRSPVEFKQFANDADPLTHVVVVFIPEGAGTRVRLVHSGWRSDDRWEEARRWQERAWRAAFAKLDSIVRTQTERGR
jgi:quinol monooxygenase YgiN/uncharacterized protein YndB with AHSA1/START domain